MKKQVSLLVGIVAVGLLLILYFVLKSGGETKTPAVSETEQEVNKLIDLDSSDIQEFRIIWPDETVNAKKIEGEWTLLTDLPIDYNPDDVQFLTYSMMYIVSDRVVEDNPSDPAKYGLDPDKVRIEIKAPDTTYTIHIGNHAPSGSFYYVRINDDSAVHTVANYTIVALLKRVNDFRLKELPEIDLNNPVYMKISGPGRETIEIEAGDLALDYSIHTSFIMKQPFVDYGAVYDQFQIRTEDINQPIPILEFVEDNPKDLQKYGLKTPSIIWDYIDQNGEELHLLIGNHIDKTIYCMQKGKNSVFTIGDEILPALQVTSIDILDKFLCLVNILYVDHVDITLPGKTYTLDISRTPLGTNDAAGNPEYDEVFMLNGKPIEEEYFRDLYQNVIGFRIDGRLDEQVKLVDPEVVIHYDLNLETRKSIELKLQSYNRDYYVPIQEGRNPQFIVSKYQVRRVESLLDRFAAGIFE